MEKLLILIGSESDRKRLNGTIELLNCSNVPYDIVVASCHRDLDKLNELLKDVKSGGAYRAVLAIANAVSNMPAIAASYLKDTGIIVVGVGLDDKGMNGIDSLLSINTIPKGVPLVTTGVGEVGLHNAGIFVSGLFR